MKIKLLLLSIFVLVGSSQAVAQNESAGAAALIADAPTCDCPEPKDPSEWDKSASLGLTLTDGNSNTLLLTGAITATRDKDGHMWDLRLGGAYGENEVTSIATDADGVETASTEDEQTLGEIVGLARYGRALSADERWYIGGQVDFLHDALQSLSLIHI